MLICNTLHGRRRTVLPNWEQCCIVQLQKPNKTMETDMISDAYNFEAMSKKRMAASALFLNEQGNVLIVKPTYRPDWLLPGGSVEDHESPREACIREVREELSLE